MMKTLAPIYTTAWRAILILLAVQIAVVSALRYVTHSLAAPPPILENAFANPFLLLHVIAAGVALVVGPLQFIGGMRRRWPNIHRATGLIYVAACAIGAPTGLMLALGTTAGPVAGAGFAILGLLWPVFTWLGVRAAIERRFGAHREWMLRSYAMAATAITLRLMLPAAGLLGFEFLPAYRLISWLSWTTNLVLVEYYIRRSRPSETRYAALATA